VIRRPTGFPDTGVVSAGSVDPTRTTPGPSAGGAPAPATASYLASPPRRAGCRGRTVCAESTRRLRGKQGDAATRQRAAGSAAAGGASPSRGGSASEWRLRQLQRVTARRDFLLAILIGICKVTCDRLLMLGGELWCSLTIGDVAKDEAAMPARGEPSRCGGGRVLRESGPCGWSGAAGAAAPGIAVGCRDMSRDVTSDRRHSHGCREMSRAVAGCRDVSRVSRPAGPSTWGTGRRSDRGCCGRFRSPPARSGRGGGIRGRCR
jgi:hypothetical protein